MCCNYIKLHETQNGILLYMRGCKKFQLSFKNLYFSLDKFEYNEFLKFLKNIDINYWEKEYENSIYDKKIPIPTIQKNLIILMDRYEIEELIGLLQFNIKDEFLSAKQIRYTMNYN